MSNASVRILLIEDNPADARFIRELLREVTTMAFDVECASSLTQGFERLSVGEFDALLLDMSLPDSAGMRTFTRTLERAPHLPIIILTGFNDEATAISAVASGAQDYLVKGQVQGPLLARAVRYAIERKRVGDEIRRLNAMLEERVAARTAELKELNQELEAFAYSVSHDLRAPLRHIEGFVQLLLQRTAGQLDETATHYAHAVSKAAIEMGRLIENLLAFSRTGRAEIHTRRVELSTLVAEVKEQLGPALQQRTITWEIGELPAVEADPVLLRVVLTNLLSNAIKFTATRDCAHIEIFAQRHLPVRTVEGGVTAASPDPYFDVHAAPSQVVIVVRDNCVGFDMQHVDRLFGVFRRLHSAEEFEGTGIGLATVRRIINRLGGRVWAEGKVDGGATFYFSLRRAVELSAGTQGASPMSSDR